MADEQTQAAEQTEEPQGAQESTTDWKAEARKWESRAKKSEAAEKELAALKESQMTEQEKALKRAEQAESELAELKAEQERVKAAREISQAEGVPLELLDFCVDEADMKRFCELYKAANPAPVTHAAATANNSRIIKGANDKKSTRAQFAQFVSAKLDN